MGYLSCVEEAWNSITSPLSIFSHHLKMKATKKALKKWNRLSFGNIFERKDGLEKTVLEIEELLIEGWNYEDFTRWSELKNDWRDITSQEEVYLKQKSRLHWLHEGVANTKFFHAMVRSRNAVANVSSIVDELGVEHNGVNDVHAAAVSFFQRLFTSEDHILDMNLINLVPTCVLAEDNCMLLAPFSIEEVREAVYSTPLDASPGIDGFSVAFFSSSLDIIKDNILHSMNMLMSMMELPVFLTHTAIVYTEEARDGDPWRFSSHQLVSNDIQNFCKALM